MFNIKVNKSFLALAVGTILASNANASNDLSAEQANPRATINIQQSNKETAVSLLNETLALSEQLPITKQDKIEKRSELKFFAKDLIRGFEKQTAAEQWNDLKLITAMRDVVVNVLAGKGLPVLPQNPSIELSELEIQSHLSHLAILDSIQRKKIQGDEDDRMLHMYNYKWTYKEERSAFLASLRRIISKQQKSDEQSSELKHIIVLQKMAKSEENKNQDINYDEVEYNYS